jgi:hypothetical protein
MPIERVDPAPGSACWQMREGGAVERSVQAEPFVAAVRRLLTAEPSGTGIDQGK